jgi:farnesyl diphosphate synthase
MNTVIGQGLDLVTPPPRRTSADQEIDFANYTHEQYDAIVKWKTAYYSFCLPVQSALFLAEIDNAQVHSKCREILLEIGNFFQVQVK